MENPNLKEIKIEKYFSSEENPVEVLQSRLYQSKDTFEILLYLDMKNVSEKVVKAVSLNICAYDKDGELISEKKEFLIDNLSIDPQIEFGEDTAVSLPSLRTVRVTASVTKVTFADDEVWTAKSETDKILENMSEEIPSMEDLLFSHKRAQREAEEEIWERYMTPEQLEHLDKIKERKKRNKKIRIGFIVVLIISILGCGISGYIANEKYKSAVSMFKNRQYNQASVVFEQISSPFLPAKIKNDIKWHQALICIHSGRYTRALRELGELEGDGESDSCLRQLNAVLSGLVGSGNQHSAGLKKDGTVVAVGDNSRGQCNVEKWSSVIAVACGGEHTIALHKDGTVSAVGDNSFWQCNLGDWKNIIAISGGEYHSVGVLNNGQVIAKGDNSMGQCDTAAWSGVVSVSAGKTHTVGLRTDGTVVAVGDNSLGACEVGNWTDIVSVSAGNGFTAGVKADGSVLVTGDDTYGVLKGREIEKAVSVKAGDGHIIAILQNGRIWATGDNDWHQCDTSLWNGVISADGGLHHSMGIAHNGTGYAVGENKNNQCDVWSWTDMGLPAVAFKGTSFESYGIIFDN